MAVYVDDVRLPFGRMIMCHMWSDTLPELHAMADAIGLQRRWFQCQPNASWNHYDIALSLKVKVISRGAILTDKFGPLEHLAWHTGDIDKLVRISQWRDRLRNV